MFQKTSRKIWALVVAILLALGLFGCDSDAKKASDNLSTAADNFEIQRQIVFYNSITNTYIETIEGRCSVDTPSEKKLTVTCKVGDGKHGEGLFVKHFLGLSDNVTWTAIQTQAATVSTYHNRIIFKPENVIPNIDIKTGEN